MTDRRPSVILADDHPLLLDGLRRLLEPKLEIVAACSDGQSLLEAAGRFRPELVIADLSMPGVDGLEATRRMAGVSDETRVMILSLHDEPSWVRAAFEAGAWAYLTKTAAPDEIELALAEVLAGRFYVSPSVTRGLLMPDLPLEPPQTPAPSAAAATAAGGETLTPREQEVVRLVGQGLPNTQIAAALGISVTTVRTHLSSVYGKLGPRSRVELALYAVHSLAGEG